MSRWLQCSGVLLGLLVAAGLASPSAAEGDPAAAERQYRIARRLAVERAPDAAEALRKVFELDPSGPLADDALLEQALLEPIPRWPEDLGLIANSLATRAFNLLGGVVEDFPLGDRAAEARYHRGLMRLEALPQHDPSAARFDLLTVATDREAGRWSDAARYAVAWLADRQGRSERARAAYHRLIVDAARGVATPRAKVGLGRLLLGEGRYGPAAEWLQQAIDEGVAPETRAVALRELAVRRRLQESGAGSAIGPLEIVAPSTGVRTLTGFAVAPDGGVLLSDRRTASVIRLDAAGAVVGRWELEDPQAVAVNFVGRAFAAAGNEVFRLEAEMPPVPLASQGEFGPISALAVDDLCRVWVADRRGERIGVIDTGKKTPTKLGPPFESRITDLAWDGRRLVALHGRDRMLSSIEPDGSMAILAQFALQRPVAVATDPSRRIAILDAKGSRVALFDLDGSPLGEIDLRASGADRPSAVGLALDGALHLFDDSIDGWVKLP